MSLKLRFALFSIILILLSFFAAWSSTSTLVEEIIEEWAVRYAEKQVLYDRQRTLQPLIRELALSRQFAQSQVLISFAQNPDDPELRNRALKEMESFRYNFLEMNYFVALYKSGEYFHNDANNTYQNQQLRYTLDPDNPADSWFYTLIEQKREMHINVNWDAELDVTKLWIDILLTDGNEALGVVGTGLNLNAVLRRVAQETESGVTNIFVDHSGAIQLHHDANLVNFSSFTQPSDQLHTVDQLIDQEGDKTLLRLAMQEARSHSDKVVSHYITTQGKRTLMAVAYLPEIDWYEVTLIDIEALLPIDRFSGILLVYGITLVTMILALNLAIRFMVLRPVKHLQQAMETLSSGRSPEAALKGQAEIGDLMRHFNRLSDAVMRRSSDMEQQLAHCQQELDRLRHHDAITGLLNRQSMRTLLEQKHRSNPENNHLLYSLIRLDIDHLTEINDRFGQENGDAALNHVVGMIRKHIDDTGLGKSARWSDDEFMLTITHTQAYQLLAIAEAIRLDIERNPPSNKLKTSEYIPLTVSLGAYVVRKEDSLMDALHHTDGALFRAKAEGRNLVRLANAGDTHLKLIDKTTQE